MLKELTQFHWAGKNDTKNVFLVNYGLLSVMFLHIPGRSPTIGIIEEDNTLDQKSFFELSVEF